MIQSCGQLLGYFLLKKGYCKSYLADKMYDIICTKLRCNYRRENRIVSDLLASEKGKKLAIAITKFRMIWWGSIKNTTL